jgi:hypothetical protein
MPGQFYLTGKMLLSNTGHSFRVYTLADNGELIFLGYVSKKAIQAAINKAIPQADICKFSQTGQQEPLELRP